MSARREWAAVVARKSGPAPVRAVKIPRTASALEERLWFQLELEHKANGTPLPLREHRFDRKRKWRFDFAWPDSRVAVEVEGGLWQGGRHNRALGMEADMEKYNAAGIAGWIVLRFSATHINNGAALKAILQCLGRW